MLPIDFGNLSMSLNLYTWTYKILWGLIARSTADMAYYSQLISLSIQVLMKFRQSLTFESGMEVYVWRLENKVLIRNNNATRKNHI